jgi:uncharacterized membrane protein
MLLIYKIILLIHITSGSVGLLTGTINIIKKKGGKRHRQIGKLFLFSMITTGVSSIILALVKSNTFLFIVGIFTIYLVGTGSRYMNLRVLGKGQKPKFIDWFLSLGMLLSGSCFVAWGIYLMTSSTTFGLVLLIFGLIGLINVKNDFKNYSGRYKNKNYWMLIHIGRMIGAYIASLTAFIVVNAKYFPIDIDPIILWLGPTLILTPFLVYWSKPFKKKYVENEINMSKLSKETNFG